MNFSAETCYTNRKRWLCMRAANRVVLRMYWQQVNPLVPRVEILWTKWFDYQERAAEWVRVHLYADRAAWLSYEWRVRVSAPELDWRSCREKVQLRDSLPGVTDLLSIACNVAAKRCRVGIMWDWINDNWPDPYRKLASDTPLDCIRALCPMRLAGDKENES